jgi:hypothetical protein
LRRTVRATGSDKVARRSSRFANRLELHRLVSEVRRTWGLAGDLVSPSAGGGSIDGLIHRLATMHEWDKSVSNLLAAGQRV